MLTKKNALIGFLILLSCVLGFTLGSLDFAGFFEKQSFINIGLLIASMLLAYFVTILMFILDFSDRKNMAQVCFVAALFFCGFFFITNFKILQTLATAIFYLIFLFYVYHAGAQRAMLFRKFRPNDIFLPVVRNGFLLLVVLLALMGSLQTKHLLGNQNILTTQIVRIATKPLVGIVNKQITAQINQQLGAQYQLLPLKQKKEFIALGAREFVNATPPERIRQFFGVIPREVPTGKVQVLDDGSIDVGPMIDELLPSMTSQYNRQFGSYVVLLPLVVAFLVFLLLQSFVWLFFVITIVITPIIFSVLLRSGVIKKSTEKVEIEKITL